MEKVNLNKASGERLTDIKGIGPAKAKNIIKYRKNRGKFSKVEELRKVTGFGQKLTARLKKFLYVQEGQKFVFDPQNYGLNEEEIREVHLVGEMNDWDPADKTYALKRNKDGCWTGNFDLSQGTEYKIMYDSENWEEGQHIGDGYENFTV